MSPLRVVLIPARVVATTATKVRAVGRAVPTDKASPGEACTPATRHKEDGDQKGRPSPPRLDYSREPHLESEWKWFLHERALVLRGVQQCRPVEFVVQSVTQEVLAAVRCPWPECEQAVPALELVAEHALEV